MPPSVSSALMLSPTVAERQAELAQRPAVVCDGVALTYRDLDQRANRLARRLMELGVGPNVLVGLFLERGVDMVVALLGVLKAGGAYVPLDPAYPRIVHMSSKTRAGSHHRAALLRYWATKAEVDVLIEMQSQSPGLIRPHPVVM
jgi:non-ribosomal peptide synthetase component F